MTRILLLLLFAALSAAVRAQASHPEDRAVDMDAPTFQAGVKVGKALVDGDSVPYMQINRVWVYPPKTFRSARQRRAYDRMVYNVKRVLPIAKEVNAIVIETYEYLQTLPNKRARDAHLKYVEQSIRREYTPRMKKLSLTQGKLLIKLVYRECNSSSYQLVRAFLGPIRAGFYQAFAALFGASLSKKYDPEGDDKALEMIVRQVEAGQL